MNVDFQIVDPTYIVRLRSDERRKIVDALSHLLFDDETGELYEQWGVYPNHHPLAEFYYQLEIKAEEAGENLEEGNNAV